VWANLFSLQLSDNPQLRVLPGCPPTRDFNKDPSGIAQFLKPYQDALALQTAQQERERILQGLEKKEREEKEEKDRKAKDEKRMEEKSSSTSTPMILQILQGHLPPCYLYGAIRDVSQ